MMMWVWAYFILLLHLIHYNVIEHSPDTLNTPKCGTYKASKLTGIIVR